jgi:hydroxymethylglutaryl-CoA lyase
MSGSAPAIIIQEVALRDGLQIEPTWVPTEEKVRLADAFSSFGFSRIELSSFVSPRAVPALRDAEAVFAQARRAAGCIYVALVPNLRGAQRAVAAGADELNLVMSASETHNRANMGMDGEASFRAFAEAVSLAVDRGVRLNGTVATAFGCPFEGLQGEDKVLRLVERYLALGVGGITLADTTGMANPRQVHALVARVLGLVPAEALTLHFHNTRGMGLANLLAAHETGATRFDAALGGLGGCPFAPGASGNICTEDVVNMCHEIGLATGLDLPGLIDLSRTLPPLLGHDVPGQVMKAGRACELHPSPPAPAQRAQQ